MTRSEDENELADAKQDTQAGLLDPNGLEAAELAFGRLIDAAKTIEDHDKITDEQRCEVIIRAFLDALPGTVQPVAVADDKRFQFLEEQARQSPTGISFDYVPSVEGEPSGWRFMRRHFIGDAKKTLRSAIDAAIRESRP